jgi:hypothetical protein
MDEMLEILDPVFGNLIFDGAFWNVVNNVQFDFLPPNMEIWEIIIALNDDEDETPPTKEQQAVFARVLKLDSSFCMAFEKAVFAYYNRMLKQYRKAYGKQADELAPILQEPSEVWALLSDPHIMVNYPHRGVCSLEFLFNTKWDAEHGLSVAICENQIGVSVQGYNFSDMDHFDFSGNPIEGAS